MFCAKLISGKDDDDEIEMLTPKPVRSTPLTEEEILYAQRRCKRCFNYYTEAENGTTPENVCYYHPGQYDDPRNNNQGSLVGWSCCRYKDHCKIVPGVEESKLRFNIFNDDAVNRNYKGCKVAERHEQDEAFANNIEQFPFSLENLESARKDQQQEETPKHKYRTPKESETQIPLPDEQFIRHEISFGDTLPGISIRYGVSVGELMRINKLFSQQIHQLKTLVVPIRGEIPIIPSRDLSKREQVMLFKKKILCDYDTAAYYMDSADYDMNLAIKTYEDDEQWAAKQPEKAQGLKQVVNKVSV